MRTKTRTLLDERLEKLRKEQHPDWERLPLHLPVPPPPRPEDRRLPEDDAPERGVFIFQM